MTKSTPLSRQVANQIVALVRAERVPRGEQLAERKLAEQMRVSRSPIKVALSLLEIEGVVKRSSRGGFVLVHDGDNMPEMALDGGATPADEVYGRLVEDRLNELLPGRITESELIRRYDMTRSQLIHVLRRASGEGWMERLPGHGWAFLPVLTSLEGYRDSYRFRLTIEPAAILEPSFVLDEEALTHRLQQQKALVAGGIKRATDAEIFELNSGLHETIMECSHNSFFIDSFRRLNRLRRLMEYRQKLDRKSACLRCQEHVDIVELLLKGKRKQASLKLARHVASVGTVKSQRKKSA
jgi:DNA-binding GntR family transcriptional regulator